MLHSGEQAGDFLKIFFLDIKTYYKCSLLLAKQKLVQQPDMRITD